MKKKTERDAVIVDEHQALEHIKDGMTVVLGGFLTAQHPMVMVRGLIKRGIKDLTVIGSTASGLDTDILIGCGCVRRIITSYVGAETAVPMGPFFKKAAEEDSIDIWETDEVISAAMLKATAYNLPFFPFRGGVGTDLPKLNPALREFRDPINNEPLLAVPSMQIDVAITHATKADQYGNVQYDGNVFVDNLINKAADFTITTIEKIVSNEEIKRDPFKTAYTADMVVKAPFGAHPYACQGSYCEDENHLKEYATSAYLATQGDKDGWNKFRKRYIDGPRDHFDYLEQIGIRNLFSLNAY